MSPHSRFAGDIIALKALATPLGLANVHKWIKHG